MEKTRKNEEKTKKKRREIVGRKELGIWPQLEGVTVSVLLRDGVYNFLAIPGSNISRDH